MHTQFTPVLKDRFLDIRLVCREVNLGRSGVYALIKAGRFPRSRKLSPRRVGWLQSEIEAWIESRQAA
jgi:prophage regulatory protein